MWINNADSFGQYTRPRRSKLKGFFTPKIVYDPRNISGDWSGYFGQYEGQRYGQYDTSCCWDFAGVESVEDQLEFLWKTNQFSQEAKNFFTKNGYIDSDGDFYLSRRWCAILSGVKDQGNDQEAFWYLASTMGLIPNRLLPYSVEQAKVWITQNDFGNDYFNPSLITQEMRNLGHEFLTHVKIQYEEVGKRWDVKDVVQLKTELKQCPLQIGIPIPTNVANWNKVKVDWDGGLSAQHSVELYKYDDVVDYNYPYFIYDQYEPHLKQLSRNYYLPIVTKAVVTAIPKIVTVKNLSVWEYVWSAVHDWFSAKSIAF